MLIIWDRRKFKKVLGNTTKSYACSRCKNVNPLHVFRVRNWFRLFFIPIFPFSSKYFIMCLKCQHEEQFAKKQALAELSQALVHNETAGSTPEIFFDLVSQSTAIESVSEKGNVIFNEKYNDLNIVVQIHKKVQIIVNGMVYADTRFKENFLLEANVENVIIKYISEDLGVSASLRANGNLLAEKKGWTLTRYTNGETTTEKIPKPKYYKKVMIICWSIIFICVVTLVSVLTWYGSTDGPSKETVKKIVAEYNKEIESGDIFDIKLEAQDTSFVYTSQLKIDVDMDNNALKAAFKDMANEMKEVFEELLQEMKDKKVNSPSVIVKYLSHDGTELYSKEYK